MWQAHGDSEMCVPIPEPVHVTYLAQALGVIALRVGVSAGLASKRGERKRRMLTFRSWLRVSSFAKSTVETTQEDELIGWLHPPPPRSRPLHSVSQVSDLLLLPQGPPAALTGPELLLAPPAGDCVGCPLRLPMQWVGRACSCGGGREWGVRAVRWAVRAEWLL